jgi:hypothetical protein
MPILLGMEHTQPRKMARQKASVDELAALMEQIERVKCRAGTGNGGRTAMVRSGLPSPMDQIERGVLHEWLCGGDGEEDGRRWMAPILVFAQLAAIAARDESAGGLLVWVGRITVVAVGSENILSA